MFEYMYQELQGPEFPWHTVLVVAYAVITAWLVRRHFRRPGSLIRRIVWAPLLLIPVVGWLLCFVFYSPPAPQPAERQARNTTHHGQASNFPD